MVDTKSNMQLADLNYIPHGGKNSKTPLIVLLESDYILSQDHSTIDNFVLASFMIQNTSIASKIRKVRSKRKNPVHAIVLQKYVQIRSKKSAQFYFLYLYGYEYSYDHKSPAYFRPNILYLYGHD